MKEYHGVLKIGFEWNVQTRVLNLVLPLDGLS